MWVTARPTGACTTSHEIECRSQTHRCGVLGGRSSFAEVATVCSDLSCQSSIPKLALKYYGPFEVLERVGAAAYKLALPPDSLIHPTFHVSQLKPFHPDFTPVYSTLPSSVDLHIVELDPEQVLERRLVKKGNAAISQVLIKWTRLPAASATWEDYNVVKARFPAAPAWGQASSPAGGDVMPQVPMTEGA